MRRGTMLFNSVESLAKVGDRRCKRLLVPQQVIAQIASSGIVSSIEILLVSRSVPPPLLFVVRDRVVVHAGCAEIGVLVPIRL